MHNSMAHNCYILFPVDGGEFLVADQLIEHVLKGFILRADFLGDFLGFVDLRGAPRVAYFGGRCGEATDGGFGEEGGFLVEGSLEDGDLDGGGTGVYGEDDF